MDKLEEYLNVEICFVWNFESFEDNVEMEVFLLMEVKTNLLFIIFLCKFCFNG
jgi:hypothetical protein